MNQETNLTLYQITSEIESLDQQLELCEEGKEKEIQEAITLLLQNKLDGCVGYSQSLTDAVDLIDIRIEQLKKAKETIKKKQSRFHEYMLFCLDRLNITEIRGVINKIKVMAPSQKVEITNESILPPEFIKTEVSTSVDKNQLKKALKSGPIPGACLVFGDRRLSFSINTK